MKIPRFNLRWLFLFLALGAIFAAQARRYYVEWSTARQIKTAGGEVIWSERRDHWHFGMFFQRVSGVFLSGEDSLDKDTALLIARLKAPSQLSLNRTPVDDEYLSVIGKLSSIRELDLSGTQVTDRGLEYLVNVEKLLEIKLDNTPVSYEGIAKLCRRAPRLDADHVAESHARRACEAMGADFLWDDQGRLHVRANDVETKEKALKHTDWIPGVVRVYVQGHEEDPTVQVAVE